MSFATQSQRMHFAGRAHLTLEEKRHHIPWYASRAWLEKKSAIARRVAKRVERATLRRLEREDLAKGITPEMARLRTVERQAQLQPVSIFTRLWRFITRLWKR